MQRTVFLDTETIVLTGPAVIIQYAYLDEIETFCVEMGIEIDPLNFTEYHKKLIRSQVKLYDFWGNPLSVSMKLIEEFCQCNVIGFNLAFDWFQLQKLYNVFALALKRLGDIVPDNQEDIDSIAELEAEARDGQCVKPYSCFDVMLHARTTEFQCTMDRKDIRIKKVPSQIAFMLADELEQRITFSEILFKRRSNTLLPKWTVDSSGKDKNFKDVILKFKPSVALKALAEEVLKINNVIYYSDIEFDRKDLVDVGYAPFATAISTRKDGWRVNVEIPGRHNKRKGYTWPKRMLKCIAHWRYYETAIQYAKDDIIYTYLLWKYFGQPACGDDNSILACMVGSVRWKGYTIDIPGIKKLRDECLVKSKSAPKAPNRVREWLFELCSPQERAILKNTGTGRVVLEEIVQNNKEDGELNELGRRAQAVLDARFAVKEIEIYDKLLIAGRFHASFKVIGALSSRMSGTDGLNGQGIKKTKNVRELFTFTEDPEYSFEAGDFDSFEVGIAVAVFGDKRLESDLKTIITCPFCDGTKKVIKKGKEKVCDDCDENGKAPKKIHGLFGMALFPGKSYVEVAKSKGQTPDMYDYGKRGIFSQMYGGNWNTLVTRLKIDEETAQRAELLFQRTYPGVGRERQKIFDMFCSMRQPKGIGSKVIWHEPAEYVESLLGFRRYFTLENMITKTLFQLAENVPEHWKKINIKVTRRDRLQTGHGATQSAVFAAAFNIQSKAARAASNHRIQSTGAQITKKLQVNIWQVQPIGVNNWIVQPCNIHDELLCPTRKDCCEKVKVIVNNTVESMKPIVPMIGMEWKTLSTWADK